MNIARLSLLDSLNDDPVGHAQPVVRNLVWQALVADDAFLGILGAHVGNKPLVGGIFLRRLSITPMAGQTAQLSMGRDHRLCVDQIVSG
jgi:hypothetical protein